MANRLRSGRNPQHKEQGCISKPLLEILNATITGSAETTLFTAQTATFNEVGVVVDDLGGTLGFDDTSFARDSTSFTGALN